jgi:outer membrane protein insertion porin family
VIGTAVGFGQRGRWSAVVAALLLGCGLHVCAQVAKPEAGTAKPEAGTAKPGAGTAMPGAGTAMPSGTSSATVTPQATGEPGPSNLTSDEAVSNPLPALPVSVWSRAGETVSAIRFEGVTFDAANSIQNELQQKAGVALDAEKVRADLRRLYGTGMYRDIAVYGEPSAGGLTLVYAGEPRFFVGRVTIEGVKSDRLSSLLEFSTKLDPGAAFTDDALPTAVDAVKDSLAQNGYFQPVVSESTTVDATGHQVNSTFNVVTGPQARVGKVVVEGADAGIDVAQFRRYGSLNCSRLTLFFDKKCDPKVGRETTSNALSGVRSYYQKNNHLEGTISLQQSTYVPERKQLDYDFMANQGPVVKVVVNGVKLSKSRTKLLVPVYEEGAVDNDLLNEGAFNIKDYLQQKGYFDVTDTVQLIGKGTRDVAVQYDVVPGKPHKVMSVKIVGNKYFDSDTLGDLLRVKKGDLYQRSGRYSAQLVGDDVSSIESLYRANGFLNVQVSSAVKDEDAYHGRALKTALIAVTFTVKEGTQQKFGTVELTGVDAQRTAVVRSLLSAQTGQPFSLNTLSGDRDAVLTYYLAHGFDHALIEVKQQISSVDKSRTDVALVVTEGEQVFVDHVLLSGIVHTRPLVVQNQIEVRAGDPLDQSALLQTQRNLYNLAQFAEVNVAVQDPTGNAPAKNVLVQLTEAKRWDVTYGVGFEAQIEQPGVVPGTNRGTTAGQNGKAGASPRVSIDVSRINLRGTQDSLTLHGTYGLLEEVATLSFNNPSLFGRKNLTGSVSGGYSNVQNITTFSSSTLQGDFRVTQKVKRADTFIYEFEYRRVSVDANSLEITPNLIPQLSEPVTVGGPQVTYFHDTRDPSPLNAGKGMFFSVQEFYAAPKFGSNTNFNKLDASYATYYTFGKHKYVFARNTRVGFERFFGANPNATGASGQIGVATTACTGTLLETNPTCNPVPLPERLYAGGATSHRGFSINTAGPRDLTTGYPVGGSGVVVNSFELRLPPPTLPIVGNSVSFVLFHDMGNVFQNAGDMFTSLKNFKQPDQADCRNLLGPMLTAYGQQANAVGKCNFNYYSHAVGVGARYNTPVGPIRLDFSYNLNPPIYPVFDDYTGSQPYVGQGSHFNFFFSIGQAF